MTQASLKPNSAFILEKQKELQQKNDLAHQLKSEELLTHVEESTTQINELQLNINPAQKLRNALQNHQSVIPVSNQKTKTSPRLIPEPLPKDQLNPFARTFTPNTPKQIIKKTEENTQRLDNKNYKIFTPRIDLPTQSVRNLLRPAPVLVKPQSSSSTYQVGNQLYTEKKTFS